MTTRTAGIGNLLVSLHFTELQHSLVDLALASAPRIHDLETGNNKQTRRLWTEKLGNFKSTKFGPRYLPSTGCWAET